jgi:hypothetical protein
MSFTIHFLSKHHGAKPPGEKDILKDKRVVYRKKTYKAPNQRLGRRTTAEAS